MSKKHKKSYFGDRDLSKKNRKKKGGKKSGYYGDPTEKVKRVKPSLNKKEIKENRKIADAPYEIPRELLKNRRKCNHADGKITVDEFIKSGKNQAIVPMLTQMVEVFGKENVKICAMCYDVTVADGAVTTTDVAKAVMVLYAATNYVLANKRMDEDEIKDLAKERESLINFSRVIDMMRKIEARKVSVGDADPKQLTPEELNQM